jgi:hypothetical protein
MKKCGILIAALITAAFFTTGCATTSGDSKVKCPKCGAIFTVDEGLADIRVGLPK